MHFKASHIALIATAQVGQCAYIPVNQHSLGIASGPSDNSSFDRVKTAFVPSFPGLQKDFHAYPRSLKDASIIGDVVDDFTPKCYVAPLYGNNNPVNLGNHMDPHDARKKPTMRVLCPGKSIFGACYLFQSPTGI